MVAETEADRDRQKACFEIKSAMFLRTGETALRRAQNKFALLNQYITTAQYNRMGVTDTSGGNSVVFGGDFAVVPVRFLTPAELAFSIPELFRSDLGFLTG